VLPVQLPEAGQARLMVYNRAWLPVRQEYASGYDVSINLWSIAPGVYDLIVYQDGQRYSKVFVIAE
jgi:hypothetical protein